MPSIRTSFLSFLSLFLLCMCAIRTIATETSNYSFQQEIFGVSQQWHRLVVPDSLFSKTQFDLSDVRILHITASNDSSEVPYLVRVNNSQNIVKQVPCDLINSARDEKTYYCTIKNLDWQTAINQLTLHFEQSNFNWSVRLEGSQDLNEWHVISNAQRIVAVHNEHADFDYTTLHFPASSYRFFRISVRTTDDVLLNSAELSVEKNHEGSYHRIDVKQLRRSEEAKRHTSVLDIEFSRALPSSVLKVHVKDRDDYERSMRIMVLVDSVQSAKGWVYDYQTVLTTTISSKEDRVFSFPRRLIARLRVEIDNRDNALLSIDSVEVFGEEYELVARCKGEGRYVLLYGDKKARRPDYDIVAFRNKIPASLETLTLGSAQPIRHSFPKKQALFENKLWLWIVMGIVMILVGASTISMMRKNENRSSGQS